MRVAIVVAVAVVGCGPAKPKVAAEIPAHVTNFQVRPRAHELRFAWTQPEAKVDHYELRRGNTIVANIASTEHDYWLPVVPEKLDDLLVDQFYTITPYNADGVAPTGVPPSASARPCTKLFCRIEKKRGQAGTAGVTLSGFAASDLTYAGVGETTNALSSSDGGQQWSDVSTPVPMRALATSGPGSFIFIAAGGNSLYRWASGLSWTAQTSGQTYDAIAFDGTGYVAVGASSTAKSGDLQGVNWVPTATTAGFTSHDGGLIYGGGKYLATAVSGNNAAIYTSTDAITWTAGGSVANAQRLSFEYLNGMFVGRGTGMIVRSSDGGATWSVVQTLSDTTVGARIARRQGRLFTMKNDAPRGVYYSDDNGATWQLDTTFFGPHFVAPGYIGQGRPGFVLAQRDGDIYIAEPEPGGL